MKTRLEEVEEMLDYIDHKISVRYPEIEHAELHILLGEKVKLEREHAKLV